MSKVPQLIKSSPSLKALMPTTKEEYTWKDVVAEMKQKLPKDWKEKAKEKPSDDFMQYWLLSELVEFEQETDEEKKKIEFLDALSALVHLKNSPDLPGLLNDLVPDIAGLKEYAQQPIDAKVYEQWKTKVTTKHKVEVASLDELDSLRLKLAGNA